MNYRFFSNNIFKGNKSLFLNLNNKFQGRLLNTNLNSTILKGMFSSYTTLTKIMFISSSSSIMSSFNSSMLQISNKVNTVDNELLLAYESSIVNLFTCFVLSNNITLIQNELIKTKPRHGHIIAQMID